MIQCLKNGSRILSKSDFSENDDSDKDPDYISEHETDTETDLEDDITANQSQKDDQAGIPESAMGKSIKSFYGKNRYKWS